MFLYFCIVEKISTKQLDIRPFKFFNDGQKNQLMDKDQKGIYSDLMLRRLDFKKISELSKFKVVRIRFLPGEARKPYQFMFRNFYKIGAKKNTFYFAKNKDFIVLNIPPGTKEVVMELDGDLSHEIFDLEIEYFLV
jgi:hypothetical protein